MKAPRSESKQFEMCPTGWTTGVCTRVIDIGTHWNEGKQKFQRKIMIGFETNKLMKEGEFAGQPFLVFANFNYSMYQNAHLCGFIEDWEGRRFPSQDEADDYDLSKLIGKPAFMNVVRSDDGKYTNIQTIGPVPEGMTAPQIAGKTILIDQASLDMTEVEKLSEKMKERVLSAKEQTDQEAMGEPQSGYNSARSSQGNYQGGNHENPGYGLTDADAGYDDNIHF
jgi:hypothetical protein